MSTSSTHGGKKRGLSESLADRTEHTVHYIRRFYTVYKTSQTDIFRPYVRLGMLTSCFSIVSHPVLLLQLTRKHSSKMRTDRGSCLHSRGKVDTYTPDPLPPDTLPPSTLPLDTLPRYPTPSDTLPNGYPITRKNLLPGIPYPPVTTKDPGTRDTLPRPLPCEHANISVSITLPLQSVINQHRSTFSMGINQWRIQEFPEWGR